VEAFSYCASLGGLCPCRLIHRLPLGRSTTTTSPRNRCRGGNLDLLRDAASGVQAALATFGVTQPRDEDILYSLDGIYDAAIFIFYRNAEPITQFAQFRGKRLSIGMPGTALRSVILQVLKATNALDASTHLSDLDPTEAIDALIAGEIDVAIFPSPLDGILLQRALAAEIRLMNVAQAEAIAKTVPGLKHVVLWRGLISLARDIPDSDIDLLASRIARTKGSSPRPTITDCTGL
jgi:hypothetical protein